MWPANRMGTPECLSAAAERRRSMRRSRTPVFKKYGATAIAVAPYFLNTGVLLRRIDRRLSAAAERHSGVPMRLAGHMGLHPRLLDLLARRAGQALDAP